MSFLLWLCIILFLLVCLFLILVILIQKGRGGGLASAFGGAGGNTAFGSKTGDVLTWVTAVIFGIFVLLAVALNLISERQNRQRLESIRGGTPIEATAPQAPALPEQPAAPATPEPVAPSVPATPVEPAAPAPVAPVPQPPQETQAN